MFWNTCQRQWLRISKGNSGAHHTGRKFPLYEPSPPVHVVDVRENQKRRTLWQIGTETLGVADGGSHSEALSLQQDKPDPATCCKLAASSAITSGCPGCSGSKWYRNYGTNTKSTVQEDTIRPLRAVLLLPDVACASQSTNGAVSAQIQTLLTYKN